MKTIRPLLIALSLATASRALPPLGAQDDFKPGPAPAWTLRDV